MRSRDLVRFYDAVASLIAGTGQQLSPEWPAGKLLPSRGVYFFVEPGEERTDSGVGPRVVRVGTHALRAGAKSTLSGRLRQHRGASVSGGGNHRGSIFRLHVGRCLAARHPELAVSTWGVGANASADVRAGENAL